MKTNIKHTIIFSSYDDLDNPFYGGGGAHVIHEIAKRFAKEYTVIVYTGTYPGATNSVKEHIQYKRLGSNVFGPKIGQVLFQLLLPFQVITQDYSIWIESFTPPFSTGFLQLFTKKPVVGLVHMLSGKDMFRKYKIPFFFIEQLGLKTYKHFIVLSAASKKDIRKHNKKADIIVIPNGIDIPEEIPSMLEKKYILFIGRIEINQKGLDLLLKAWANVAKKNNFVLAIAGSGIQEEMNKLNKLVSDLGLSSDVKLFGTVLDQEKEELFKNSLFVVLPSRFETFSLVVLEAFSYKLPVISFNIEGLSWIPKEHAIQIKQFDTAQFTLAIEQLINNETLRKKLSQNMDQFIQKYNWATIFKSYQNYISSLI